MNMDEIWIGNDHGGYDLKLAVLDHLRARNIAFRNVGCDSSGIVRYPYYASLVAEALVRGHARRGILICSTGIGMSIVANRYPGVRASLCTSTYMGRITRAHNDSNVLCLGGKITGVFEALDILDAWLDSPFEAGRHNISLSLIEECERSLCTGDLWSPADPMQSTVPST